MNYFLKIEFDIPPFKPIRSIKILSEHGNFFKVDFSDPDEYIIEYYKTKNLIYRKEEIGNTEVRFAESFKDKENIVLINPSDLAKSLHDWFIKDTDEEIIIWTLFYKKDTEYFETLSNIPLYDLNSVLRFKNVILLDKDSVENMLSLFLSLK